MVVKTGPHVRGGAAAGAAAAEPTQITKRGMYNIMSEPSFTAGIFAHGREVSGETFMSPMVFPYFPNTAFFIPDLTTSKAQNGTFSYVRFNNPDRTALADVVTFLEDGEDSVICSSGMGAITTTMISLLNQGDEVICNSNIYGETHQIMNYLLPNLASAAKWWICGIWMP